MANCHKYDFTWFPTYDYYRVNIQLSKRSHHLSSVQYQNKHICNNNNQYYYQLNVFLLLPAPNQSPGRNEIPPEMSATAGAKMYIGYLYRSRELKSCLYLTSTFWPPKTAEGNLVMTEILRIRLTGHAMKLFSLCMLNIFLFSYIMKGINYCLGWIKYKLISFGGDCTSF